MRLADARLDAAVERGPPAGERPDAAVGVAPPRLALELLLLHPGRPPLLADHGRHRQDTVDGEDAARVVARQAGRPAGPPEKRLRKESIWDQFTSFLVWVGQVACMYDTTAVYICTIQLKHVIEVFSFIVINVFFLGGGEGM